MIDPKEPICLHGFWWIYDERTQTHRPAGNHAANRSSNVERVVSDEPFRAGKGPAFDTRCRITIISYRVRLCDADGISAKAAIDGLTHCGVLRDDSPKEVSEVCYRQVKVKNASEEKTEIVIERD